GRQTQISDATARTTTLGYDAASQLQSIDYSDSQTADVDYDYDLLGRRTRMVDGSGTSSYAYDSLGRLTSKTDGSAHTLGYSYDLAGHLTKTTYPAGLVAATAPGQTISDPSVTSSHDNAGRVSAVTDWLGHRTEFDYDADGNPTAQRYPNQTSAAITYDHADRQTRRTDSGPGSTTILDLTATRNANGQLATQTRDPSPPPATQTLTYDALDQLTQATTGSGPSAETYSYAHDVGDRLTRIASPTADTTLVYDAANQLTQTKDTTTGTTTQTFTYDLLGDRTSQDPAGPTTATTYSYDQANRLTGEHNPASSPDITYAYDGDGLRADVLWDTVGGLPVIVADSAGLYVSGPDGLPLTQLTFSGQQRYYHHDQLGSTRAITDAAGAVTARYSFDPYGNPTTDSSGADSRFGYAGQYTDHATALIYMRARWYDPATGQFLTRDPLEAITGSAYGYANADPINLVDPSGLTPWWMRASNAAAGELNVLTAGLSNRIAGAAFGFDASCANFGEGYGTGEGAAALALIATGVVGGARAIGARAAKGGGRLPWAGHRPYVAEPRASALPKRPAEARVGLPARATRHAQGQVPAVERIRRERQAGP
ncbi:MAG: hypothetical protein QOJ35_4130, partial [Solirubrobacteraceae bacterium]|nr:hypothetical protein [Solirubrobacteraceae bacterium]